MKLQHSLFFICLILLCAFSINGRNYYVSLNNGDDSTAGTIDKPWRHIAYATNNSSYKIKPGDTLFIDSGTYHENNIDLADSGSSANPIVIRSYHGKIAVINGDTTCAIFTLGAKHRQNNVIFDSLHIINGYIGGIRLGENYLVQNVTIRNCLIEDTKSPGDNSAAVLLWRFWKDVKILKCTLKNNKWKTDIHTNGVQLFYGSNVTINNCDISGFNMGIYFKFATDTPSVNLIENNFIHHNYAYGVLCQTDNVKIKNNLIVSNIGCGVQLWYSSGLFGGSHCRVEHNTIYNHRYTLMLSWGAGFSVYTGDHGARNDTIVNNLLWGNNGEYATYMVWGNADDSAFTNSKPNDSSNYNWYYNSAISEVIYQKHKKYLLSDWKSAHPTYDNHSIVTKPLMFKDTTRIEGFKLDTTSPGYKAASDGTDIGANVLLISTIDKNAYSGPTIAGFQDVTKGYSNNLLTPDINLIYVNNLCIKYAVPYTTIEEIHFSIVDMQGRCIWKKVQYNPQAGKYSLTLNRFNSNLASGIYLFKYSIISRGNITFNYSSRISFL